MLELSSCVESKDYYITTLLSMNKNIDTLYINVDRGVYFTALKDILIDFNLKSLILEQNYSLSDIDDFYDFIKTLKLKEFKLIDIQSEFLKDLRFKKLLSVIPNECNYNIIYNENTENYDFYYCKNNQKIKLAGQFPHL